MICTSFVYLILYWNIRWQIKPRNLEVTGAEPALRSALEIVSRELGTQCDYKIEASLYKLLLYEEGCFFAKHRDNERLDGEICIVIYCMS